jgi:hypothetical protein
VYELDRQYSLGYSLSALECALAIVTANLPTLWPVYRRWFPNVIEQLGLNLRYEGDVEIFEVTAKPTSQRTGMTHSDCLKCNGAPVGKPATPSSSSASAHTPREVDVGNDGGSAEFSYKTRWARQQRGVTSPRTVYAHRSIGGTSFVLDDDTVPAYWRDLVLNSGSLSEADDEDPIELYHGIVKQMGPAGAKGHNSSSVMTNPGRGGNSESNDGGSARSQNVVSGNFPATYENRF